jgi:hypothetical protein
MLKRGFVIGIIILFIGTGLYPATGTIVEDQFNFIDNEKETLYKDISSVNDDTEYWALLIAGGVYAGYPELDLPGAHEGPEFLRKKLLVSEHWKGENIKVITNKSASLFNIIRGFRWLDKREDENDISMVYIFTHGGPLPKDKWPKDEWDGDDEYLLTYFGGLLRFMNLRDDALNLLLSRLESKGVCVIIESCFSGGFNDTPYNKNSMNGNMMNAEKFTHEFAGELSQSGRVILMSCSENEFSGGLIFTKYLIEGLAGFADINDDHMVSAEEAFEYAYERTEDPEQHPTIYDDYTGELQLTDIELPPTKPDTPAGQDLGDTNTTYYYTTVSIDPEGSKISYGWDWNGDSIVDEWTDPLDSNSTANTSHSWAIEGIYNVKVIAKDNHGLLSDWSDHIDVIMCNENIPDQMQKEADYGCSMTNAWIAQGFVPSKDTLSKVEIGIKNRDPNPPPLHLYIRDNLTGDNLAESSQDIPELGDDDWAWFTFDFKDINITPGKTYYIVCKKGLPFVWKWRENNPYPPGKAYYSMDGNEWHTFSADCCFVTWAVKT